MTRQERIAAILEKCEFYWNQDGICDAEIHAVLEGIHEHAREIGKELAGAADVEKLAREICEVLSTTKSNVNWMEIVREAVRRSLQPPQPQKCEGCKTGSLDYFEHDGCLIDKVVDKEQARWQKSIYDLARKHAIAPDDIDGSGCDSGDPLDLTLAEIGQVICQLENPQDYRPAEPPPPAKEKAT
jgi:hypothetical protein